MFYDFESSMDNSLEQGWTFWTTAKFDDSRHGCLTGVDLDNVSQPKWKVEKLMGDKVGADAFAVISDVDEYTYLVVRKGTNRRTSCL